MGNMEESIIIMLCGLSIVFLSLIILVVIFWLFGQASALGRGGAAKAKTEKSAPAVQSETRPAGRPAADSAAKPSPAPQEDGELLAVIAAAVAGLYEGGGTAYAIRSVRRVQPPAGRSAWASAGLRDNTRAF